MINLQKKPKNTTKEEYGPFSTFYPFYIIIYTLEKQSFFFFLLHQR